MFQIGKMYLLRSPVLRETMPHGCTGAWTCCLLVHSLPQVLGPCSYLVLVLTLHLRMLFLTKKNAFWTRGGGLLLGHEVHRFKPKTWMTQACLFRTRAFRSYRVASLLPVSEFRYTSTAPCLGHRELRTWVPCFSVVYFRGTESPNQKRNGLKGDPFAGGPSCRFHRTASRLHPPLGPSSAKGIACSLALFPNAMLQVGHWCGNHREILSYPKKGDLSTLILGQEPTLVW